MQKKYHHLIEKLKLDHKKYRELINECHLIVERILEIDDHLDELYSMDNYDEDVEQGYWEGRDHLMGHLDENWGQLKQLGISMTKQEYFDLIDYQNVR